MCLPDRRNRAAKTGGLRAPTAPRIVRGARRPDPSARWKVTTTALRAASATRDASVAGRSRVNASLDPAKVAEWLARQGNSWFPAPCWAVVARDNSDRLTVMADTGLNPGLGSVVVVRDRVGDEPRHGTADRGLEQGPAGGGRGSGTVMAPAAAAAAGAWSACWSGIDPQPSALAPSLGAALLLSLRGILEPAAIALDNALASRRPTRCPSPTI